MILKRYEDGPAQSLRPKTWPICALPIKGLYVSKEALLSVSRLYALPLRYLSALATHLMTRNILRKEVIQPQVPLRLPCYDFTPVAELTVVRCPHCWLAHGLRVNPTPMV